MFHKNVICFTLFFFSVFCGVSSFAESGEKFNKSALIVSNANAYEWIAHMFQPTGLKLTRYYEAVESKNWKERGAKLPPYSELKKYDLVFIGGGTFLTAEAKTAFLEYIKNGGTIFMIYSSFPVMKEKTGELAFGIAGFDGYQQLCKTPYTGKEKLSHKIKYTKAMGKEREYTFSTVMTIAAKDLVDAVPLIVFSEKPEMVNTCYVNVGKGRFIFSGFEDFSAIVDVLKALDLAKK